VIPLPPPLHLYLMGPPTPRRRLLLLVSHLCRCAHYRVIYRVWSSPSRLVASLFHHPTSIPSNGLPRTLLRLPETQLLLAHTVLKYEIEPLDEEPQRPWLNNAIGLRIWDALGIRRVEIGFWESEGHGVNVGLRAGAQGI
jgi:hypothetical protein